MYDHLVNKRLGIYEASLLATFSDEVEQLMALYRHIPATASPSRPVINPLSASMTAGHRHPDRRAMAQCGIEFAAWDME